MDNPQLPSKPPNLPTEVDPYSPALMIQTAIEKGIDAAGIKILAEVHERMEAARAERAYNDALSDFQALCPVILKKKEIEFPTRNGGKFTSRYAEMDTIIDDTRELRSTCGFAYSFEREVTDKHVMVTCIVRHRGGHKTGTTFSVPIPKDAKLSEAHSIAGACTFAERYAFRGAFGITTGMPDNDGKDLAGGLCTEEQRKMIQALIDEIKPNMDRYWKYLGVTKLEDLPASDFARAQSALFNYRANQEGKK